MFWRECIVRLGEASAKGKPRCLWAIHSPEGDAQLHITARGRAALACPQHWQRTRLWSHRRGWAGGHGPQARAAASLHPRPRPISALRTSQRPLVKQLLRMKYKLVLTRRLTPCPFFALSHCAWGNMCSVKAATRLRFVKRNPCAQQH